MLSPSFEPLPSTCLQLPTGVGCISLHERRGYSGASTTVPADYDSHVAHSGSILPLTLSSPPDGAPGVISPRSFWSLLANLKQNTTVVKAIVQTIVAGVNRTAAATVAARFPALAGLPSSRGCRCVFAEGAAVAVEILSRDRRLRILDQIHTPPSPALFLQHRISSPCCMPF